MVEKIGPYRVYERLGVGGMGEVYKAYDDRLDRWVAIKRIRPDREDAEDTRERFKREARATARLNHPSIVHLYGIFQEDESDCIVMEYVEGETLDAVLSRGPLDPLRVASLGHEIASGLAEAHANGILHRDLKAENIMITPRGRAKILDFGLAKPILRQELDPVLTGKGQLVGTSRAMSPEYVSGEEVDHRSDLFSLGVLLYESLTGHSPFKAHNTLATLKQVMLHKQTPPKTLDPRIPPELSDLIDRLLEKDPQNRPQSAHEVALAFGRVTGQVSSGAIDAPLGPIESGAHPRMASSSMTPFSASDTVLDLRPRRQWIKILTVVAVLVVGAFALGGLFDLNKGSGTVDEPNPPPDERVRIIFADLDNTTTDPAFAPTLEQALRTVLDQSDFATVLSRSQMRDALDRMGHSFESENEEDWEIDRDLAIDIARREGVSRVVTGNIARIGKRFLLAVEVINPNTGENLFADSASASSEDDLIPIAERLAKEIRGYLGESFDEIERSTPLAKVATPDYEALKAYTKGLEKFEAFEDEEAINFFRRALQQDPEFAMAHARLGVIYSNMTDRERALEHLDAALQHRERLDDLQTYYVQAWKARWTTSPEEVVDNWSFIAETHPDAFASHYNLGIALRVYRHDFEGAAVALARAAEVAVGENERNAAHLEWAMCQLALGRPAAAADYFANRPADAERALFGFVFYAVQRQHEMAIRLLNEREVVGNPELQRALAETDRNRPSMALDQLDQAEVSPESRADELRALVSRTALLYFLGDRERLAQAVDDGIALSIPNLVPETGVSEHSAVTALASFGKYAARAENPTRAREALAIIDEFLASSSRSLVWNKFRLILAGEIALTEKRHEAALLHFDEALRLAPSYEAKDGRARTLRAISISGGGDAESVEPVIEELRWLVDRRGLAFMECFESCFDQTGPVITSNLAHRELAQILSDLGREEEAAVHRQAWEAWKANGEPESPLSRE